MSTKVLGELVKEGVDPLNPPIQILDALGNPLTSFPTAIELSFLLPDGVDGDALSAYFWDEQTEAWASVGGSVVGGRFVVQTSHLSTYALFQFGAGGGFNGTLPASGVTIATAQGGTLTQLRAVLARDGAQSVFISYRGRFVGYVLNAPDFVNAEFLAATGGVLTPGQALMVVIR
ncbi:MAG: hypothetical protein O3A10_06015 [Chloroflexi bacterium]|nr:hypothetical protein [Chloroflexota bacterium]MDA1145657.1 hypothetical protein [Chloroflexota bacterium]